MNIKYLALLFFTIAQTADCMHYIEKLFSITKHHAIKSEDIESEDDEQLFQEIKFIYIDDNSDIKQITLQMISATRENSVKGIILLINCHGGSMTNFAMLHDTIKKTCQFKPVVSVVTHAFSGGYLIASATDYIIAHRCSEVGSIGVIMEIKHFKNPCLKKDGIETEYSSTLFKGGEFKDVYHTYGRGEFSEKEREYLQKDIETAYDTIVSLIAENRSLDKDESEKWANARTFMAHEALKLGLIDQIGTLFDAEEKIVELMATKSCSLYPDYKIKYSFCNEEDEF